MLYKIESYNVIGAAIEVHKELSCGFVEQIYQDALAIELAKRNIGFEKEKFLKVFYKGIDLNRSFRADFVCYDKIIVELKAVNSIKPEHEAQLFNYLKVSGLRLGLLFNFGSSSLEYKRIIL